MANIELDGANKKIKVDSGDLTLDVPGDIILDADGADLVFADGGTNILKVTNSSSDVVFQPQVDAKDIIFKQYDGTTVATVEDNGTFNIPTDKLAINGTAVTATAAELNLIDGGTARGTTAIADGDGVLINDAGTMRMTNVTTLKTYIGRSDPSSADGDSLGTASLEWSDLYLADGGIIYFGNDQDVTLTHDPDDGLFLKSIATGDDNPVLLTLQTGETDLAADDVIGKISFQAPDEGTGTDAVLVSGAIQARAEGDFSSSSNATSLDLMTGSSEAATTKLTITSDGRGLSQFTAKVWCNYNGNGNAVRDSHNVSSVDDNGTGDYTYNFSNNLANTNYAVVVGIYNGTSHGDFQDVDAIDNMVMKVRVYIGYASGTNSAMTAHDVLGANIVIFGD